MANWYQQSPARPAPGAPTTPGKQSLLHMCSYMLPGMFRGDRLSQANGGGNEMTNVVRPSLIEKYLEELAKDEAIIAEAAEAYESARARLDVGLRRYIALRDFVEEQLGNSPYAQGIKWPGDDDFPWTERGRFRFTGMSVGDAITQVLEEEATTHPNHPWLDLAAIIQRLSDGGLGFPEPVQARAVNAALLKTTGIKRGNRRPDGVTMYSVAPQSDEGEQGEPKGDDDLDSIPF